MQPKLDALGIVVRDMAAALAFYRQLGWGIPAELDSEGHAEYTLPNGLRVMWDTYEVMRMFNDDWQPPAGTPRISMAFLCAQPSEVDAIYARMTGAGYHGHKPPWDAFWGQRYAVLKDPDGSIIDLFAPLNTPDA
jgi:uncharacterized glyoxalase superfamily protein PhnB